MNAMQKQLLLKRIEVLLRALGNLPEFPATTPEAPIEEVVCKVKIIELKSSVAENGSEQDDEFDVDQYPCESSARAQADAKFLLRCWEAQTEAWRNQRNARELNSAGCLYVWVRKNCGRAAELFLKAHPKANEEEKKIIEANLALIQPFI
jgi:hypothetical protein